MLFVQHSICIASCCQCPAGKGIAGTQILLTDNKSLPQNTMLEELKPAHLVHVPSSAIEVPVKCHRHPVESQPAPQSCAPEKLSVLGSCLQRLGWTPLNSPVNSQKKISTHISLSHTGASSLPGGMFISRVSDKTDTAQYRMPTTSRINPEQ